MYFTHTHNVFHSHRHTTHNPQMHFTHTNVFHTHARAHTHTHTQQNAFHNKQTDDMIHTTPKNDLVRQINPNKWSGRIPAIIKKTYGEKRNGVDKQLGEISVVQTNRQTDTKISADNQHKM